MSRNILLKTGDIRCRVWHNGSRRKVKWTSISYWHMILLTKYAGFFENIQICW